MAKEKSRQDNREFAKGLEVRTRKFAVAIISLSAKLHNSPEGKVLRNQITKSGTSIGANYREANRSRSKADFQNRIKICESEASDTQYWLEVISLSRITEEGTAGMRRASGNLQRHSQPQRKNITVTTDNFRHFRHFKL